MTFTEPESGTTYEQLRTRGEAAARAGRFEEALPLLEEASEWAQAHGDSNLKDRAYCNRAAVLIEVGRGEETTAGLRAILIGNADADTCWLAAYHLARVYEYRKEYKKGLFYARIARDRTRDLQLRETSRVASSHNQLGNFLVAESHFAEAAAEYEQALALEPVASRFRRALLEQNLGYCRLLLGKHREGLDLLYRSLRTTKQHGARRQAMFIHLDLAFGLLEVARYRYAHDHALKAFRLAEELDNTDCRKNALYMLGEAANLLGEDARARHYFDRLQQHFPDTPFLSDFLLAIDIRKMINLRA